jgi:hypothetical protein
MPWAVPSLETRAECSVAVSFDALAGAAFSIGNISTDFTPVHHGPHHECNISEPHDFSRLARAPDPCASVVPLARLERARLATNDFESFASTIPPQGPCARDCA